MRSGQKERHSNFKMADVENRKRALNTSDSGGEEDDDEVIGPMPAPLPKPKKKRGNFGGANLKHKRWIRVESNRHHFFLCSLSL